jgi:hypothetical protein
MPPVVPRGGKHGKDAGRPFRIGSRISVYVGAMIYAGRHPAGRFLKDGSVEDHLDFLKAGMSKGGKARLSWDIYCEIIRRIERGEIKPLQVRYLPSGEIDPVRTVIRTSDLARLARERGERPEYLRHLLSKVRECDRRTAKARREVAVMAVLKRAERPGENMLWKLFCAAVREAAGVSQRQGQTERGFSDEMIENTARAQMKSTGERIS